MSHYRNLKNSQGYQKITQLEHLDVAGTKRVTDGILVPGKVITDDASAAPVLVGKGSIVRVQVASDTYLAFGDENLGAVSATTSPAIKLPAGYHLIAATDDFMRASANPSRIEIIEG